jgi:hypothetical protein
MSDPIFLAGYGCIVVDYPKYPSPARRMSSSIDSRLLSHLRRIFLILSGSPERCHQLMRPYHLDTKGVNHFHFPLYWVLSHCHRNSGLRYGTECKDRWYMFPRQEIPKTSSFGTFYIAGVTNWQRV